MRHVIGMDAGGSKTHALVMDESGRAFGFGQGGPGNHQGRGLKAAMMEVFRAASAALQQAHLTGEPVDLGVFSLAGADFPEDYAMLQAAVEQLGLARKVIITNDSIAALRSGVTQPWGVVVICGTGFNAAGRAPDGKEIVLPAIGPISGDWGGGESLGYEVMKAVMRAWDGRGKPTQLTQAVLGYFGAPSEDVLLSRFYHQELDERCLHTLAPMLFETAERGDEVSRGIVVRMGEEVGVSAKALIRRLGLQAKAVEVVLGGSVFKEKGTLLTEVIQRVVHEEVPQAKIVKPRYEPVVGAALLALEALGIKVDEGIYQVLDESIPEQLVISIQ